MPDPGLPAQEAPKPPLPGPVAKAIGRGFERLALALTPKPVLPFGDFIRKAWAITEPGKELVEGWHLGFLAETLTAVSLGQINRLIINIFPRSLKSTIVSVDWPTWEWTYAPERRFMFISHEISLSTDLSMARRAILESEWYRGDFPKVVLAGDQNEKKLIQNTRRGKLISTSTKGSATGKGGNRIVPDDYLDPDQAESDTEREAALAGWGRKFSSRLDDPQKDAIVVVEQRLHPRDFTAKLEAEGGWTKIVIPSDNYTPEPLFFSFPISKKVVKIEPGEATFPERKPMTLVLRERTTKGSRTHDAQERQAPQDNGAFIFRRENWKYYQSLPDGLDEQIISFDTSFKGLDTSDFVVGQVWGRKGANIYLLDQIRGQMGITGTMAALASLSQKWPHASRKLIEEAANGAAVIELMKNKIPGLVPVKPLGGKIVRARAIEAYHEAGNIHIPIPANAKWVEEFIDECATFPNGVHDDQVDAMSQAVSFLEKNNTPRMTIL